MPDLCGDDITCWLWSPVPSLAAAWFWGCSSLPSLRATLIILAQSVGALFERCRLLHCARQFNQIQTLAFHLQCVDTCECTYVLLRCACSHVRLRACVCGVCACSCACVRLHVRVPVRVCECTHVLCSCARALGRMRVCARLLAHACTDACVY